MPSLCDKKACLRRDIKALRTGPNEIERARATRFLCDALWPFLQARPGERIAVHLARPFELSLDPLIKTLLAAKIEVCAPRLDIERGAMEFFRLDSLEDVQLGPWNVRQPPATQSLTPDVVLVPGLAFDACGHRLGTGGGWYDRTLSPAMLAIGVAFDFQIVAHVPVEAHDFTMNWVFSNKRIFGPLGEAAT